jgi:hypothetical protein
MDDARAALMHHFDVLFTLTKVHKPAAIKGKTAVPGITECWQGLHMKRP